MRRTGACALLWMAIFLPLISQSQTNTYIRNGSATQNDCNCYTLTQATDGQSGSVWNANKIDLRQSFDMIFNVYLGCKDADGADGIVFILQPLSTSVGTVGGGMGFSGVRPSIGIALDTWQNTDLNDPLLDHISIQANGDLNHNNDLSGPYQASAISGNIEDCRWHTLRITWDGSTHWLRGYFDGILRVESQTNLITDIFNNDPMVYWGFSAATGGANNLQQFCTALNPDFNTDFSNNSTCIGNGTINFNNTSASFAPITDVYWNFGDGSSSTDFQPAPHLYTLPGLYPVKLAIKGFDGCFSDTLVKTIAVGDKPVAAFQLFDTCEGAAPRIIDKSSVQIGTIGQWNWILDGQVFSSQAIPDLKSLPPGTYSLTLVVESSYGCLSDRSLAQSFSVKAKPIINALVKDGCERIPLSFTGEQIDNATSINQWNWNLGDNRLVSAQNTLVTYDREGTYFVSLQATASNGCQSEIERHQLKIIKAVANAGKDTMILQDKAYQLSGSGGISYTWSPSTGLNDPLISNPIAILREDQRYRLTVKTMEGCEAEATILLSVFKGSYVFMPSAFTPNNDGLNDFLKPGTTGIKRLEYFMIYNRWGQLLFTTKDPSIGWNGNFQNVKQSPGVYVWKLRAIDFVGKIYEQKGTITLIR